MNKRKVGKKTYFGEEAELLTAAEQMAHNARNVQARNGTYDFSDTLRPAPTDKPLAFVGSRS